MKKLLLGVGALLMASAAVPASAHDWNGYSGYRYGYGGGYYDVVRQHVRACRQHERFHERLNEEHDQLHDDGVDNGWDHSDAHDALDDAHDRYHDTHGGAQNCGYWNQQYYNMIQGSRYRGGNDRGYGWSFQFGSGY